MNRTRFQDLLTFTVALLLASGSVWAAPVSLTVDPDKVVGHIDGRIYSQFLEHIYHSCNGGLWGDVVWNRSFEELPPVKKGEKQPPSAFARHWEKTGGGQITLDTTEPLNSAKCVKIVADAAGAGIRQSHFCLRKGEMYRMFASTR
jgi:hypothetical protein